MCERPSTTGNLQSSASVHSDRRKTYFERTVHVLRRQPFSIGLRKLHPRHPTERLKQSPLRSIEGQSGSSEEQTDDPPARATGRGTRDASSVRDTQVVEPTSRKISLLHGQRGLSRVDSRTVYQMARFHCKSNPRNSELYKSCRLVIYTFCRQFRRHSDSRERHRHRKDFLVLKARRLAREVLNSCIICKRFKAKPGQSQAPCLPNFRLETTAPFRTVGVDFAGPLMYNDDNGRKRKGYLLIFACPAVRCVHLEPTKDMTTFEFILAFRRFVSRFPFVENIFSDNALTSKRAATEFKIMFRHLQTEEANSWFNTNGIRWDFITEKSPWRGSTYERLIQVAKRPLRKILQRRTPFLRELETILIEIEAMINSRPLTPIASNPDDIRALSPADLIFGYPARTRLPNAQPNTAEFKELKAVILSKRHLYLQNLLNAYWKRFQTEYLQHLRNLHIQKPCQTTEFATGDVVLIHNESPNRAVWPLGRIVSAYGGDSTDTKKRSCVVKRQDGKIINRPTQLLHKLEY